MIHMRKISRVRIIFFHFSAGHVQTQGATSLWRRLLAHAMHFRKH